jgi:hypothetical protein
MLVQELAIFPQRFFVYSDEVTKRVAPMLFFCQIQICGCFERMNVALWRVWWKPL